MSWPTSSGRRWKLWGWPGVCKCNRMVKTPYCGKPGCERPTIQIAPTLEELKDAPKIPLESLTVGIDYGADEGDQTVVTTTAVSASGELTFTALSEAVEQLKAEFLPQPLILSEWQYETYSKNYPGGTDKFADDLHYIACSWGFDGFTVVAGYVPPNRLSTAVADFSAAILDHEARELQAGDGSGVRRVFGDRYGLDVSYGRPHNLLVSMATDDIIEDIQP